MKSITLYQFTNRYNVLQKIGSGSFGDVFRIEDILTKRLCALKKIKLRKNESLEQFLREIQIQMFLAHPLVIKIFEFYVFEAQNPYLGKKQQIGIVMELGKRSLLDLIQDKNQHFPLQEIINFAYHFIKLFAYFQDQNIVHRDIKPENFIQVGQGLNCKLIDFGLCSHINDIRTIAGSFHYFSPALKRLHYNPKLKLRTNPYKDDVYSFGLTLYELITRRVEQSTTKWGNSRYSRDVFHYTKNGDLTDIIQYMLEDDEEKRPDFIELFQIFNQKFTFYEQQNNEYNRQSLELENERMPVQQYGRKIPTDQSLIRKQKEKMNQSPNDEMRRTYKQQILFQNGEYEFRTIKEVEKQNFVNFENKKDQDYIRQQQSQFQVYNMCQNYNSNYQLQEAQEKQLQNQSLEIQNTRQYQKPQIQQYQIQPQQNYANIAQQQPQKLNYQRKNYHLGPKINITSIIIIKEFIICGCHDGSLYILNTQKPERKSAYKVQGAIHHHTCAITAMGRDRHGRLWTCSQDSQLLVWDRPKFFFHLLTDSYYHQQTVECTNNKGQNYTKIHNYIEMDPDASFPIKIPQNHPTGISSLHCVDDLNFVVGFNDGSVFAVWDNGESHYEAHTKAVTAIKIYEDHLLTSGLDGLITVLELDGMEIAQNYFQSQLPIKDFIVTGQLQNPHFVIVTKDGRGYEVDGWSISVVEQNPANLIDISASIFVNQHIFFIAKNGNFYRNGLVLEKCQGEGWNCLHWNNQDMMAMGNDKGDIVMIRSQ